MTSEKINLSSDELNRGIMKFDGANLPTAIAVSSILTLGTIGFLIWWAFQFAYGGSMPIGLFL
ncbi:MAG: hypothetical protein VKJ46_10315 [Leptolyngbyaceae bacterium]|nr:hypothetical protein [Leptolyngbyaceae bacterium]